MKDNYKEIALKNLKTLYLELPGDLGANLPARRDGDCFMFQAFGQSCTISPTGISLGEQPCSSVFEILISLYALNAGSEICIYSPFKAFKEIPGTGPYVGAFTTHTEQILVPHVHGIQEHREKILKALNGVASPQGTPGDFSMVVYPLPKIALCYIFYGADEDFDASVTCLYSANAERFLPVDGLADVGEYTSRTILELI